MRKFLGTAMALALVYGTVAPAHAEILKNLQTSGDIDFQADAVDGAQGLNSSKEFSGQSMFRVLAGAGWDLSDDASAKVSFSKNNRLQSTAGETLQQAALNDINVSEANIMLKNVMGMNHTIGRQYYGDQGALNIYFGPTAGYVMGLPVTSIDAWRADWSGSDDKYHLTAIAGKTFVPTNATTLTLGPDTDTDLAGVVLSCSHMKAANLGLSVYQQKDNTGGAVIGNAKLYVGDLSAKGSIANFSYKAEVMRDFGDAPTVNAGAFQTAQGMGALANAAFKAGGLKISGEFAWGSGDDKSDLTKSKTFSAIASDYRPGLIWGGLSAIGSAGGASGLGGYNTAGLAGDGTSGLTTANVGIGYNPSAWNQKLTVDLRGYWFSKSQAETENLANAAFGGPGGTTTSKALGDEADLTATWKQSENVSVVFGYGMFFPGAALKYVTAASDTGLTAQGLLANGSSAIRMSSANVNVRF